MTEELNLFLDRIRLIRLFTFRIRWSTNVDEVLRLSEAIKILTDVNIEDKEAIEKVKDL